MGRKLEPNAQDSAWMEYSWPKPVGAAPVSWTWWLSQQEIEEDPQDWESWLDRFDARESRNEIT